MNEMKIVPATTEDIPELVGLVNSGYRGDASKKGWTTEAELLKGELRIDIPTLQEMIAPPETIMLKAIDDGGQIAGCVFLQVQARGLYLGLLTVSPVLQASGIGKKLLSAAEDFAKAHHCSSIFMQVISIRSDLVAWYERHGYRNTGERKPFPTDNKFGVPTVSLEFAILEKDFR